MTIPSIMLGFFNPTITPPGQQAFITAGTFTFTVPIGITSISVVAVGGGGGGAEGANNAEVAGGGGGGDDNNDGGINFPFHLLAEYYNYLLTSSTFQVQILRLH